jgi:hypothetical protein
MPTQREWRERDAARADQQLFDRAADWLREDPKRRRVAGLWADRVGHALADLLDALGDDVANLDEEVRWQTPRVVPGVARRADGVVDDTADPEAVTLLPSGGWGARTCGTPQPDNAGPQDPPNPRLANARRRRRPGGMCRSE